MNLDPGFRELAGIIAQVALVGISVSDLKSEIRITAAVRIFEVIFKPVCFYLLHFRSPISTVIQASSHCQDFELRHVHGGFSLDRDVTVSSGLQQLLEEL